MFTIGKVATRAGISTDAVRYYEREGLLDPKAKTDSGYRLYDEDAVRRLRFIRHAQECGFTLAEIRALLQVRRADDACCNDVRQLALEKKLQLEAKIRSMRTMSNALDSLIATCVEGDNPITECPILGALERLNA